MSCEKCGKREAKLIHNPFGEYPAFQCLYCGHIELQSVSGFLKTQSMTQIFHKNTGRVMTVSTIKREPSQSVV